MDGVKKKKEENKLIDKNGKINHLGLFTQMILTILLVFFIVISMFMKDFYIVVEYIFSFLLFVMSYNNYTIYKRRGMTMIYFVIGIIILVTTIITNING